MLLRTRKYDPHKLLYGLKERVTSAGELPRKRRDENLLQTPLQAFEHFFAFGNPERERGRRRRMLLLHIQDADQKAFRTTEGKCWGQGRNTPH